MAEFYYFYLIYGITYYTHKYRMDFLRPGLPNHCKRSLITRYGARTLWCAEWNKLSISRTPLRFRAHSIPRNDVWGSVLKNRHAEE